jgi:hypothetical protein
MLISPTILVIEFQASATLTIGQWFAPRLSEQNAVGDAVAWFSVNKLKLRLARIQTTEPSTGFGKRVFQPIFLLDALSQTRRWLPSSTVTRYYSRDKTFRRANLQSGHPEGSTP